MGNGNPPKVLETAQDVVGQDLVTAIEIVTRAWRAGSRRGKTSGS